MPLKVTSDGECDRKVLEEFITNLSVILRAVSSKQTMNTHQLDQLCKETAIKLHVVQHYLVGKHYLVGGVEVPTTDEAPKYCEESLGRVMCRI